MRKPDSAGWLCPSPSTAPVTPPGFPIRVLTRGTSDHHSLCIHFSAKEPGRTRVIHKKQDLSEEASRQGTKTKHYHEKDHKLVSMRSQGRLSMAQHTREGRGLAEKSATAVKVRLHPLNHGGALNRKPRHRSRRTPARSERFLNKDTK